MQSDEIQDPIRLFNRWLAGKLEPREAQAVQEDIARPDSRIFTAIAALDAAMDELLGDTKGKVSEGRKDSDGTDVSPKPFASRYRSGQGNDGGPPRA